jgi:hypothetical protein
MEFTLTVRDSDGDTDTATVTLLVHPILDANRFLQYVRNAGKLRVVAARAWTADQRGTRGEFDIQLRAHVTYRARSGNLESVEYDVADPVAGSWLPSGDDCTTNPLPPDCTGDGANDFRNPLFQFGIPAVDLDAITRQFQDDLPDSANSIPDPAFVDDATLAVSLILTPRTATSDASLYVLDQNDAVVAEASNGGSGAAVDLRLEYLELDPAFPQVTVTVNELLIAGGGLENVDTAISYYTAIDPASEKTTLEDWLAANCIDLATADDEDSAIAHAVYVNNYDLGFGRDMYFRTESCSSNPGTVASVVINYLTLENAVKKIDPIIAVAMENIDADPSDSIPGVATFYAFAPEQGIEGGTGGFRRVRSVNFDGRGEKFLPGACTMCHGGRPKPPDGLATYEAGADVGATFMPWDLESFLYSDSDNDAEVDQTFPTDPSNANLVAQYSRDAQEAQLKALNLAAYGTYGYVDAPQSFACFPATAEHPLGFAGPCELVELWYGGAGLPSSVFLNDQTPPEWAGDGEELYQDVFARHCRACHVQRVAASAEPSRQFRSYSAFMANRDRTIEQVFDVGGMPGARLTMDRLWQPGTLQDQSAGDVLADHLADPPNLPPVDRPTPPGDTSACFNASFSEGDPGNPQDPGIIPRNVEFRAEADCGNFANEVTWELSGRPLLSTSVLTASTGLRTAFTPDKASVIPFAVTLHATGPSAVPVSITKYYRVENGELSAGNFSRDVTGDAPTAEIDVMDPPSVVEDGASEVNPVRIVGEVDPDFSNLTIEGTTISLVAVGDGELSYEITDVDGDTAVGSIDINVLTIGASDLFAAASANTSVEIDVSGSVVSSDGEFEVFLVSGPTLDGTLGTKGAASCSLQGICNYDPPTATITRFAGGVPLNRDGVDIGPDSFVYKACLVAQPMVCDSGTASIHIDGQSPFAPVADLVKNNCTSCHQTAQPGAVWLLAEGAAASERDVWCAVALPTLTGSEAGGLYPGDGLRTMINPASPQESLLYVKPNAIGVSHGGGDRNVSDEMLDAILNWIREGGAYTADASQNCP